MAGKRRYTDKHQVWIDARKRFRLSHMHIQMARELGMNPKKFAELANTEQQPWKAALPDFIEACYLKRFGKERPETIRSIEQLIKEKQNKKEAKKANKKDVKWKDATKGG